MVIPRAFRSWPRAGVAILISATAACGTPDLELSDIVGTWEATEIVMTDVESSEQSDLIADGIRATLRITAEGTVTSSAYWASQEEAETSVGTIRLHGNRFTVVVDADTTTGTARLRGDQLTLDSDPVEFFNSSITLLVVLRRRLGG